MVVCKNCKNKPICNIYSDIEKHLAHINIEIQRCNFLNDSNLIMQNNITRTPAYNRTQVDSDKINELSNKVREDKIKQQKKLAEAKPKTSIVATPLVLDHTCNTCGASTFKEDSSHCDECGKEICSCCATVDGDSNRILCESCWIKL